MKNTKRTPEEVATNRLTMIAPLLTEGLDPAMLQEHKKQIAQKYEISIRTVGRYLHAYQRGGFTGLQPKLSYQQKDSTLPKEFPALLAEAIVLRRECATRSVRDIIRILEMEGQVNPGVLKRSTLQHHLQAKGFGTKQMRIYTQKGTAARRYQKDHRGQLYQGDIKYGPYLPIGTNGTMKQVYLAVLLDDATRYVVAARFYDNQRVEIIEDNLRRAIMQYGKPDKLFVDNGKQYRSHWLKGACGKLGIVLLHSKPYHPEGKGKVEYFNRRVDSFLAEVSLEKPKSLETLNELLDVWLSEHYHKSPHSALQGVSPETAFRMDTRPLAFVPAEKLADAFLHAETREVDKVGCLNFGGKKYEVGMHLLGRKVEIRYDPCYTKEISIHHPDYEPFLVRELAIGTNCGRKQELPPGCVPLPAESSRLLAALKPQREETRRQILATTFRKSQEVSSHV